MRVNAAGGVIKKIGSFSYDYIGNDLYNRNLISVQCQNQGTCC